jgi:Zn-dependent M16 (insulinase) family peptidase
MTLSITEDDRSDLSGFVALFPQGQAAPAARSYESKLPRKLGIRIPAQVSYACLGYDLAEEGIAYNGTAALVSNILSLSCLWNEIRVQGGAYGAGMRIGGNGAMFTYSYRDPSPNRSLEVYRNMGKFLKEFAESGEDITGFIISSISDTEPLLSPSAEGRLGDQNWFADHTYEDAKARREQMLTATPESLAQWCGVLDALREKATVAVVGYADALDSCAEEGLTVIDI